MTMSPLVLPSPRASSGSSLVTSSITTSSMLMGQLSRTLWTIWATVTVWYPWLGGQSVIGALSVMIGGGLETVVAVVAVLLPCSGSKVAVLTVAVLLTIRPLPSEHFTWATKVIVAEAPGASEAKETARLFSAPLQTPPPVAPQEVKVAASGRMSVTVTD